MNFQTVNQNKGMKDEQGFPVKIDLYATLNEIQKSYLNKNNTPCTDCVLTDDNGEKHKVTIYKDAPSVKVLGTRQGFKLWAFDGSYPDKNTGQQKSYVGYSGFWTDNPPKTMPQPATQTPPQAAQSTKLPPGIDITSQIMDMAERFLKAIETLCYPNATPTQPTPNPDYVGDEPEEPEGDIPF